MRRIINNGLMIRNFFSTPEKPVEMEEFLEFWLACSLDERDYFRSVDLTR